MLSWICTDPQGEREFCSQDWRTYGGFVPYDGLSNLSEQSILPEKQILRNGRICGRGAELSGHRLRCVGAFLNYHKVKPPMSVSYYDCIIRGFCPLDIQSSGNGGEVDMKIFIYSGFD